MRKLIYPFVSLLIVSACQQKSGNEHNETDVKPSSISITNPVLPGDRPDPTVIQVGEEFYASTTSNEWAPLFPIYKSSDLQEWELVNYVFPDGAPEWAKNNFWAPELSYDEAQGKIYAYYTARDKSSNRLSVAVASSSSPTGLFEDHGPLVAQEFGSIDAYEVRDDSGKIYVLWKEDGNSKGLPTPIWAQEINEQRTRLMGKPVELFRNDQPWEKNLVEGVSVFKENGFFYATYSAGACCDKECNYQTGVARSKNLLGPWEKYGGNPILADNDDWHCAGHGTVLKNGADYFMLYHAYNEEGSVYVGREGVLEKLTWTEDQWPVFENEATYSREKGMIDFKDTFEDGLDPLWQWRVTQNIKFETGDNGLLLKASEENENMGSLLVQSTKSTNYDLESTINMDRSDAKGGVLLVGAANNGFGAPIAGIGIAASKNGLELFEMRDQKETILQQKRVVLKGKIAVRMEVAQGYLLSFAYKTENGTWESFDHVADASHLVPWGMGFRIGMFAKGAESRTVNFIQTRIANH
ncbi:glycoside hydrolase family 43 protein [Cyclobacterium plantarum]|uniref:Family 43 glycosylhydrolase n=1 Tax=Cyclobacterium plantarum TaxID=2716263 RepID=A0ABX0H809_9BACT|nr:glycoside hydrolase family 43 protein [Cyclobacterium plantarum]NHE57789.1 family 43 glycosylhydrolase [Cyclobacterium plantarum]